MTKLEKDSGKKIIQCLMNLSPFHLSVHFMFCSLMPPQVVPTLHLVTPWI